MSELGSLELAAASTNLDAARALAAATGGVAYCDEREAWQHLPFRALVTVVTDDVGAVARVGDVGVYVVYRRIVKAGVPALVALFPLLRAPALSHADADAHWRDVHAPLALEHHEHMTYYAQLSVVSTLAGTALDGFALCGFATLEDLRQRFYSRPESVEIIAADVKRFADVKRSPPRLIAKAYRY